MGISGKRCTLFFQSWWTTIAYINTRPSIGCLVSFVKHVLCEISYVELHGKFPSLSIAPINLSGAFIHGLGKQGRLLYERSLRSGSTLISAVTTYNWVPGYRNTCYKLALLTSHIASDVLG